MDDVANVEAYIVNYMQMILNPPIMKKRDQFDEKYMFNSNENKGYKVTEANKEFIKQKYKVQELEDLSIE